MKVIGQQIDFEENGSQKFEKKRETLTALLNNHLWLNQKNAIKFRILILQNYFLEAFEKRAILF